MLPCPLSASPAAQSAVESCTPPFSVTTAVSHLVVLTATAATRPATPGRTRRHRPSITQKGLPPAWNQPADTHQLAEGGRLSSLGWDRNCRRASHSTGL